MACKRDKIRTCNLRLRRLTLYPLDAKTWKKCCDYGKQAKCFYRRLSFCITHDLVVFKSFLGYDGYSAAQPFFVCLAVVGSHNDVISNAIDHFYILHL